MLIKLLLLLQLNCLYWMCRWLLPQREQLLAVPISVLQLYDFLHL